MATGTTNFRKTATDLAQTAFLDWSAPVDVEELPAGRYRVILSRQVGYVDPIGGTVYDARGQLVWHQTQTRRSA